MDTARRDHLGLHGYERPTTPNLEELAKNSTVYDRAYTPGGWTPPAHASLFTGLFSIAHQTTQEDWRMGDHLTTLAEVVNSEGYETIGIVENPMLNRQYGFDQGFSRYYETWQFKEEDENRALLLFRKGLADRTTDKPFFVFINLIEPHSPYNSSKQFYHEFVSDRTQTLEENMWREFFLGMKTFSPAEISHLNELYDAELLYVDYLVGRMIDELKAAGDWDKTVFIVTSDHGENIGDHEMMDHVFSLHESIIRIPLVIHYPVLFPPGTRHDYPVQLTDVFPTVIEIIGAENASYLCQGRSLLERQLGDDYAVLSAYYFPRQALRAMEKRGMIKPGEENERLERFKRRTRAVIVGETKLIWGSDGKHELYDLGSDPGERQNLIDDPQYAATAQELLALHDDLVTRYDLGLKRGSPTDESELDESTRQKLKSLGYVQ
jgi:arylsulfatase A-like enzyme